MVFCERGFVIKYLHDRFNPNNVKPPVIIRGFTRIDLAGLFCEVGFSHGAEIGVRAGKYSKQLCLKNKGLKLICVDPWTPYKATTGNDFDLKQQELHFRNCKAILRGYRVGYIKKKSSEAVLQVSKNLLDFVYIDADHHYKSVKHDVENWSERVRPGGIVSGHDYSPVTFDDVFKFVNLYAKTFNIELFATDEYKSTWFFAKGDL
jgi:hypothetical protein